MYIRNIVNFLLFLFLSVISYKILFNLTIFDIDDLNSTFNSYGLLREENGRYVCNMLSRIFCVHIPNLLGIHLQNAINTIGLFIYFIILSLLFSSIASFCEIKYKNLILYILFWFIAFLLFAHYAIHCNDIYSAIISFQYGYALAVFWGVAFLSAFFSILIKNKYFTVENFNIENKTLIYLSIIAFCSGNSNQIISYSVGVSVLLNIIVICFYNHFEIRKLKYIFIEKKFIFPVVTYLSGFLLMVLCPGFWQEVSWRHADSFSQVLSLLCPFTKDYIKYVFINNSLLYGIILFLVFAAIIKNLILKQEKLKEILINIYTIITPIIGVILYHFMLILGGKTFPGAKSDFWVAEPFYLFVHLMILCATIGALCGFIIKNKKILALIFIILIPIIVRKYDIPHPAGYINDLEIKRKDFYLIEKMIATSIYQNKDIIIPESFRSKYTIFIENDGIIRYIKSIYGIDISGYNIYSKKDEDALLFFESIGGSIDEKEQQKADFQKLFDKNFILKNVNLENNK